MPEPRKPADAPTPPKGGDVEKPGRSGIASLVIALLLGLAVMSLADIVGRTAALAVRYDEIKRWVGEDRVASVDLSGESITATLRPQALTPAIRRRVGDAKRVSSARVEDESLLPLLEAHHVSVTVTGRSFWSDQMPMLVWMVVLFLGVGLAWRWVSKRVSGAGPAGALAFGKSRGRMIESGTQTVTFADVAGVDEAKEELLEIVEFLRDAARFTRLGARIPKGVLLLGPPGTGKTLLARAVAGEASVPFFSITGSEFVEMFVGVGASRVRDLFAQAKARAPCIVFIDELDALGRARGAGVMAGANEEREQTLDQLLAEMDGFEPNAGVVVMAATNRPEVLDPALMRPGRFDRQVVVDRPDRVGREAILKIHAAKLTMAPDVDLRAIAERTPGFAGADLANLLNEAALRAARKRLDSVGTGEISEAIDRVVGGLERRSRIISPEERRRVAFHEVGHAIVGAALDARDRVHKVSIVPRGAAALGFTMHVPMEDRYVLTERELSTKIAALLGGRASEHLVFGDLSTGAQDDLRRATEIARAMVVDFGMSSVVGPIALAPEPRAAFLGLGPHAHAETGARLADGVDAEVRRIVEAGLAEARRVLESHRELLDRMAAVLLEREALEGAQLDALLAEVGRAAPST